MILYQVFEGKTDFNIFSHPDSSLEISIPKLRFGENGKLQEALLGGRQEGVSSAPLQSSSEILSRISLFFRELTRQWL